jgi:hypothetical protein
MSKSFWVIETANTTYWDGRAIKDEAFFTSRIDDAIKFYDFASAEVIRCWLIEINGGDRLRSTEHMYTNRKEK